MSGTNGGTDPIGNETPPLRLISGVVNSKRTGEGPEAPEPRRSGMIDWTGVMNKGNEKSEGVLLLSPPESSPA